MLIYCILRDSPSASGTFYIPFLLGSFSRVPVVRANHSYSRKPRPLIDLVVVYIDHVLDYRMVIDPGFPEHNIADQLWVEGGNSLGWRVNIPGGKIHPVLTSIRHVD